MIFRRPWGLLGTECGLEPWSLTSSQGAHSQVGCRHLGLLHRILFCENFFSKTNLFIYLLFPITIYHPIPSSIPTHPLFPPLPRCCPCVGISWLQLNSFFPLSPDFSSALFPGSKQYRISNVFALTPGFLFLGSDLYTDK